MFLRTAFDPQAGVQRSQSFKSFMPNFSLTGLLGCAYAFCFQHDSRAHNRLYKWVLADQASKFSIEIDVKRPNGARKCRMVEEL